MKESGLLLFSKFIIIKVKYSVEKLKFSEMLREYIDLRMEETHHVFGHEASFNMIQKRNERIDFLEREMDKKVLDSEEKV